MSVKRINLSDAEEGKYFYHVAWGTSEITGTSHENGQKIIYCRGMAFGIDGKEASYEPFPSLFHSREEFLDFHAIAPVRMTEKELRTTYNAWRIINMCANSDQGFKTYCAGFLLFGGQIIEEPKNLPCPVCGSEMVDHENNQVRHPNGDCVMAQYCFDKKHWNDPSKRGGK